MTDFDLVLYRRWFSTNSTIGELFLSKKQSERLCYLLEDEARPEGVKLKTATCIPAGEYFIEMTFSNRFQRKLPLIYNKETWITPNGDKKYSIVSSGSAIWEGIRIHPGNDANDTEGCQLPGTTMFADKVIGSKIAFDSLLPLIVKLCANSPDGKIKYLIVNDQI